MPAEPLWRRGLFAMTANELPEERVRAVVSAAGGAVLEVAPDLRAGEGIQSVTYYARGAARPG